jgi:hypothetical protein
VKERQTDRPWCLHCQPATSKKSFPNDLSRRLADCEQVLEHPDQYSPAEKRALGPHLFALGVVRTLPDEEFDLLVPYVRQKLRHRNGYQPLLALTGFDIIKTAPGQELVLTNLEQRYRNWLGRQYYPSLRQVLPSCLEHWKIKGWLESIQEGAYRRVAVLPPFYQPPEKQE